MKKNVLVFGILAGVIVTALMVASMFNCYNFEHTEGSMYIGYASMLLAFSFIFVAIKNYRDKYNGGSIGFGKGFLIGLYISLIASTLYVGVWLIDYYVFMPDFMDKYSAHVLKEMADNGASATEIADQTEEMAYYKEMYKNPLFVILFTYFEILPVGLLVSLLAALILKRKRPGTPVAA